MEREQDPRNDVSADTPDTPIFNELLEGRRATKPSFLQPIRTKGRAFSLSRHSWRGASPLA